MRVATRRWWYHRSRQHLRTLGRRQAHRTPSSPGGGGGGGRSRPQEGGVDGGYPGGAAARKDLRNPPLSPATQVLPKRFARALDPLRALRRAPASAGQPPCPLDQRPGLGGAHHLQPRLGDGVSPGISPISESDYSVKYQSWEGRFASLPRSTAESEPVKRRKAFP